MKHVIFLNISNSTHCDFPPHSSYHTPYKVATQWYNTPAINTSKVLIVRQTYPQGMILLKQKSIMPNMYSRDKISVPKQTMLEPYQMK